MSLSDMFVYEGDYFGLDEWWYNIGGTKAYDSVETSVKETVQGAKDTVSAPFRYLQENAETISTVWKYAFWGFVILGGLYIAVSMQKLLTAIGIYHDLKKVAGAASTLVR